MLNLVTIEWKDGSMSDTIIDWCVANKIDYRYNHYFELQLKCCQGWINPSIRTTTDTVILLF